MPYAADDGLIQIEVAVSDLDVEATLRTGTNPSLVVDRRPLTAKVRQGDQITDVTLQAFGESIVLQEPPPILESKVVYTKDEMLASHPSVQLRRGDYR
jgi:hypothetical protein